MRSVITDPHCRKDADRSADSGKTGWERSVTGYIGNTEAGGTGFLEIAGESFRRQLEALPLKKEEIDQFLIFAGKEGYADETMQIRAMELSKEGLERTATAQQREITQKCRLAVGLGAMSGMFLVLLLL